MVSIKLLKKDNYLAMIKNSLNSRAYSDIFITNNNHKKNITKNGSLSCAYFVSSILKIFNLIDDLHLTVAGTISELKSKNYQSITKNKILPGDIIVWSEKNKHEHIGFYIGNSQAISNSSKLKKIKKHHYTFNKQRVIEKIFRPKL
ncbi:hypothetical protein GW933_03495 [Candidatus Falkowbacteria bacterium]|uniref:NlpC/P60 domain-containing protein n=1 Tax=Candidatus Buchananbacteria bacterium CG10_big_fil_rev_8_21_14_0_10_33_19 TaxID=1974525 RepID=A0A2H0W4T1_9BACT|nr:hypothetical protein [Candidatus Falkowbacteria bacterium]PIS06363.1 MAG: hypothetical protein COT80_02240 [Candidatus Buchananbacteria bacterium CG10_big_fil_rev_8_21_14_0_10_33_19]